MGSGIGGLTNIENNCKSLFEQGPRRISPFFVPGSIINMVSGFLSIHLGIQGPNYAVTTACTTGTHSIGMAARNIAYGEADVMIAGGSEMAACGWGSVVSVPPVPVYPQRRADAGQPPVGQGP